MTIATWNVNGLRTRLDFVLRWLNERQPDLVGLQELKLPDEEFPRKAFEDAGYHAAPYGQQGRNGVAVLSRKPLVVVRRGLPGQEELGARLITADAGDLSFTTVYCPSGKSVDHADYRRKLEWFESLLLHFIEQHNPRATMLCGDFNLVPAPIDSWKKAAGVDFETADRFEKLLAWGFTDLFRQYRGPSAEEFSFWSRRVKGDVLFRRHQGIRIDFLLGTADVVKRLRHVKIDCEYRKKKDGSDHAPVLAVLRDDTPAWPRP